MTSRPTRPVLLRLALVAAAGVVALLPVVASSGPAVASATRVTAATGDGGVPADAALAAGWLAGERDAAGGVPGPFAGTDWGLTVDTLWALRAGGASDADLQRTWGAVEANAAELAGPPSWSPDPTLRFGGGTAKVLVAAQSVGADPRAVHAGGTTYDMLRRTLDLVATTGPQAGRIEDSPSAGSDSTNVFGQALAVIGLSDAGVAGTADASVLRSAVGFLQSQQCAPGWYRVFYDDGLTCDAALAGGAAADDVDGTAMAVQALVAARDAGLSLEPGAVDRAVAWLVSAQHGDGSFGGGASTSGANANSTGLAAVALALGGRPVQADLARTWVSGLQLTATTGPLAPDRGAIAYDAAALADARTGGLGAQRDQWRRTTGQAVFALNPVALSRLADLPAGGGLPTGPTTPPTTPPTAPPTPAPTASPTAPVTPTPTTSAVSPRGTASTRSPTPASGPVSTGTPSPPAGTASGAGRASRLAAAGRPSDLTGGAAASSAAATPAASAPPTTAAEPSAGPGGAGPTAGPAAGAAQGPAQGLSAPVADARTGAAGTGFWRSPVTLAVVVGVLLGLAVVLRPWRRLRGRAR